jgi:hypothetical protein
MAHSWNEDRAVRRIRARLAELASVDIKDYVRNTDLANLSSSVAYRVDGVHLYADILNLADILGTTSEEGVTCHRRTLRFLHQHYRAVHRILQSTDIIEVDFHNQRLHAVVAKPYGDEQARVHRAVAVAQLIIDVLKETGADADDIPPASVRVGIDSGLSLAVNNGRRGHREPLFLGEPANHAAKRAAGGDEPGIFLTNVAREVIDLEPVADEDATALTDEEVAVSEAEAQLPVGSRGIVAQWRRDLEANPIGRFEFSGHTPPFSDLDFESLSPLNSRRQDAASLYADIDGFTAYVALRVDDDYLAKDVVKTLHVVRGELDAVLDSDFGGRKVRFIGDCVQGVLAEGTAQTTASEETVETVTLCAAAMRSSFELALAILRNEGIDTGDVGLAIGFDFGPIALTRLGMKGSMVRCSVGRAVLRSEDEQQRCSGSETAIGAKAYYEARPAVKSLFGKSRIAIGLDYGRAIRELVKSRHTAVRDAGGGLGGGLLERATPASTAFEFPERNATPKKPSGFA